MCSVIHDSKADHPTKRGITHVSIDLCHWELYWKTYLSWTGTFLLLQTIPAIEYCTVHCSDWLMHSQVVILFLWRLDCKLCLSTRYRMVLCFEHISAYWKPLSADYCHSFYTVCHKCVSRFILTLLHSAFVMCVHQQTLIWVMSDFLLWNHVKWWK